MRITRRRNAIVLSITLGACLVALAIALNVAWVIINWRSLILLVVGIAFFLLLIAGLILNTIFLVREVRRNERHDSFLNAVTHELKTPITSIRLYLETLQRRELPESQRQEFYDIMLSDSERLLATVEQVLKAGEVGQRGRNQVRLPLVFDDVVRDCIRTMLQRYHLQESTIHLTVDPDAEESTVIGNPEDLRTAVLNILDNAVKYSPKGPQTGGASCSRGRGMDDAYRFRSWPGHCASAPEADLQALLPGAGAQCFPHQRHWAGPLPGPLHRPPARWRRGRGIGGRGPRRHHPAAASPRALAPAKGQCGEQPANILVVEDEAHLAQGLLFNLRAEGYTVQLAVDGETALEMIAADSIDAIILDVMLPGRDGFSVAAELRAQQNFVPILMLTARGRPEDVLNGFSAGADDYLPKPFDLSILLARLNGLLRRMAWLRPRLPASPAQPPRSERLALQLQLCRAHHRLRFAAAHHSG